MNKNLIMFRLMFAYGELEEAITISKIIKETPATYTLINEGFSYESRIKKSEVNLNEIELSYSSNSIKYPESVIFYTITNDDISISDDFVKEQFSKMKIKMSEKLSELIIDIEDKIKRLN